MVANYRELFNRGNTTVNISGWAVQYASSTGTTWSKTDLSTFAGGMLAPGKYLLIQGASAGMVGANLPAPDVTGTLALAATAGKVVLTSNNTLIASGTSCPSSNVIDIVGYGSTANCFEGAGPTPAPSATNSALRAMNGCTETDNNNSDFTASPVNPRNNAAPAAVCGAPTNPSALAAANPNPVAAGNLTLLTATVTPGTTPTSTGLAVTTDLTAIGGGTMQAFADDGMNGDAAAGDNVFSLQVQIPLVTTPGAKMIPITVTDAQARSGNATINLNVLAPIAPGAVVISQLFGGGGNSGAPFINDYVELFNRSAAPVNITGWSVQYSTAAGASWQKVDLAGTIPPGKYFLVQLGSGGANGAALPLPDATGTIAMASTAGKVALVNNGTLLTGSCPIGPGVIDFVGYGTTANCFEGPGPAAAPSSTRAIVRLAEGCADSNDNSFDFLVVTPNPRNSAAPANDCSGGALFTNFAVQLTDPATCTAAGNIVTATARFTNSGTRAQGDNPGPEFTAQLPALLLPLAGSCTSFGSNGSTGVCVINAGRVEWNGGVKINETITITFQAQVNDPVTVGAQACIAAELNFDSNNDGINNAVLAQSPCVTLNCPAVGPGAAYPAQAELSDQKPGSLLVFPFYSSSVSQPTRENARISLTNIEPTRRAFVHLFFIQDDNAAIADLYVCLTPNQTVSVLASDIDPDISGYVIAIATDERGCPINFNYLIGDVFVKLTTGHAANLAAESFAALPGAPLVCSETATTVELLLDGVQYNRAPRVLALDAIPSPADGNSTLVIIDRVDGNLVTGLGTVGNLFGLLFDDIERSFSFDLSSTRRQYRFIVSNSIPRTVPRVSDLIPAGRTGWMKFNRTTDSGIIGAAINYNPNLNGSATAFNQGHNLHKLTLTAAASLTVPIFPPNCF